MTHSIVPTTQERGRVCVTVPAEEEFVGVVRMVVASAAATVGLGEEDIADLKVAVSEACTNAVLHAYDPTEAHPERTVEINMSLWDGLVEIDVCDKGGGVRSQMPPCNPKLDSEEGGFGLTLIGSLMDSLELIGDTEIGTRLKFFKRKS